MSQPKKKLKSDPDVSLGMFLYFCCKKSAKLFISFSILLSDLSEKKKKKKKKIKEEVSEDMEVQTQGINILKCKIYISYSFLIIFYSKLLIC